MDQGLIDIVKILRDKGDYQYILNKYVDSSRYFTNIKGYFENMYIYDATDFNYSTCFTFYLNISDIKAQIGDNEFDNYIIKNQHLNCIQIQISAIAPYATYKFIQYIKENGQINMKESFEPFMTAHYNLSRKIDKFLIGSGLTVLKEPLLSLRIEGVVLEKRTSEVTVYHCLFEDEY